MKILITGARGLLGQKLITLLHGDADITLVSTGRNPKSEWRLPGDYVPMEITDEEQVQRVIADVKPDIVIHGAAMTQVDQCEQNKEACWRTNVTATGHIIAGCRTVGAHLIYVSTDFIFDGSHGPLDENEKPNPVNYYGESKLAAEQLVQSADISWCIIRTVLVYGITDDMSRSNIVLWVKNSLEQGKPIRVVNDQWRTPTLAEDLSMGCYLAAKKKAKGVYHISGKDFMSPYEIAIRTADYFKLDKALITPTDSASINAPAMRPLRTGFIIDKARKELGYEPRSFEEGIAVMVVQMGSRVAGQPGSQSAG